jgi:iron complex transport system substrate-binding protein
MSQIAWPVVHDNRSRGKGPFVRQGFSLPSRSPDSNKGGKTLRRRLLALCLAVALAAACGSDSKPAATNASSSAASKPTKIVSLSATATEMLFAIGAGSQVIAVDDQSNFPPEAPKTNLSGYTPNVEAIAGYQPDLVIVPNDTAGLIAGLQNLKIDVLTLPPAKQLSDSYRQLETLGTTTGHESEARKVVAKMQSDIAALVKEVPQQRTGQTYYYELDNTFFTATSNSFVGAVLNVTGLKNIADAVDDGTGFPQLSVEKIVAASPDFIFLADTKCCQQSKATVSQRPGWSTITAVQKGQIVELDDDIASRWGPRIVDLLRTVVEAVKK